LKNATDTATTSNTIRNRTVNLLKNIFKLSLVLLFLKVISGSLNQYVTLNLAEFTITGEMIANGLSLVFIVYHGYSILTDGSFLIDVASKGMMLKLGVDKTGTAKTIVYDVTCLIALVLAAEALIPILGVIPESGPLLAEVTSIVFIAVGFLLVYHLGKGTYSLMRARIDQVLRKVSEKFEETTIEEAKKKGRF